MASLGYDATTEPGVLKPEQCRNLQNLLPAFPGQLRGSVGMTATISVSGVVYGVGWLYPSLSGSGYSYALIVWQRAGNALLDIYTMLPTPGSSLVQYSGAGTIPFPLTANIKVNGRVRMIPFGQEVVIVQDGSWLPIQATPTAASYNKRFTFYNGQPQLYDLGIPTPSSPVATINSATPFGGAKKTAGPVQYTMTFVDELGRESSPAPAVVVELNGSNDAILTATGLNTASAGQVRQAYLYATTVGGSLFYRIAQISPTAVGQADPSFEDNLPDSQVSALPVGPNFGENAPPAPATLGIMHRGRLILDVANQPGVIQVSNLGSPTQFSVFPLAATDGEEISSPADPANKITGFASYRGFLLLFQRRGLSVLNGSGINDYELDPLDTRGCISADSIAQSDNYVYFLSDDGVYKAHYLWRLELEKISLPIEADLYTILQTAEGRNQMETAVGWFADSAYHLAIGPTIFRFDLNTQGWSRYNIGSVQSAVVVQGLAFGGYSTPGFALVGRSDAQAVSMFDTISPGKTVYGMVWRTRLLQPDPADELSRGQTVYTLRKRVRRVLVKGEGLLLPGSTMTVSFDGRTEIYSSLTGRPSQGILIYQECSAAVQGRAIDVTLALNGTGVVIREITAEYVAIG